jgi:hypothetical protein
MPARKGRPWPGSSSKSSNNTRSTKSVAKKPNKQKPPLANIKAMAAAREADAAWFEAHPRRSHRLRPAIVDELPGIDIEAVLGGTWIAIRQLMPGFRAKMVFTPSEPPADDEATAHAHFDLCLKHTNKWLPRSQIDAHIFAMSRGGRA